MSAEATGWVWKHSPYRSDPRKMLIHLAVADVVNDTHGNQFWMSNEALAAKVGSSRTYVNTVLAEMVEAGLLRVVYAEHGRTVIYEMVMGVSAERTGVSAERTGGVCSADTELKRTQEELKVVAHPSAGRRTSKPRQSAKRAERQEALFDEFWAVYPRKVAKKAARTAWDRITRSGDLEALTDEMAAGLSAWLAFWKAEHATPHGALVLDYIPYPATWLNQRRWEDQPAKEAPAP